jgi:hypothetical protein
MKLFDFMKLGVLALSLSASINALGHFEKSELEGIEVEAYLPTAVPDRIILTLSGNPATEMAVNWRSNNNTETSIAQIAISDGSPFQQQRSSTIEGHTQLLDSKHYESFHHSVRFKNLTPDTLYIYRVGDGQVWSEWMQFRTAKDSSEPFSFIYFGDAQNDLKSRWSRVVRQAYSDMPKANFILHAGDLVNTSDNDQEWGQWFYSAGWINGSIPSVATPGNHEYDNGKITDQWGPHFTFPKNGPRNNRLSETVYYFDYQGVRFISLDTPAMDADPIIKTLQQKSWLRGVLEDNPNHWTVVFHHHPMHAATKDRSGHAMLNLHFKKLYEKYNVDLVLQGHDHSYARGKNLSTGGRWFGRQSPMYVVSVSGPKMYEGGAEWAEVTGKDTQLYQLIDVRDNQIHYRAFSADGKAFDEFKLIKDQNGKRQLID